MSRALDLTDEIKEYLEEYYPDEEFSNLYEASSALLELSKDPDEYEDDGYEGVRAPMSALDKAIQEEERYLQREKMEMLLQIQERELQKLEEHEDVSDGADHAQAIAQEIGRQIAERVLQIEEEKEIEALQQLA